jgi:glycosyltransferase involved in cell wall biosynthesis
VSDGDRKLAIFLSALAGGGAERSMLKLAGGIAKRGLEVELVLAQAKGPYLREIPASVRTVDLGCSRTLTSLPALVRYLRSERPQALLSSIDYVNVVALWAKRLARVPVRTVVNEQNTLSFRGQEGGGLRWVPGLARRFYPWADAIAAVSAGVANDLADVTGLPRERIDVIHNPVVTPELQALKRGEVDDPWLAPGQPPVLLGVGRLTAQKDFPTLLRAFARVRRERSARLLILGEGEEREALEALVRELGLSDCVRLPGFAANPYACMSRATLFVLSSRWEGLPTVLIEALACGLPIVSTDCPSGPQEILAGGRFGALVPVRDEQALARTILAALDGRTPRPTSESWQPYALDAVVDRYLETLFPA